MNIPHIEPEVGHIGSQNHADQPTPEEVAVLGQYLRQHRPRQEAEVAAARLQYDEKPMAASPKMFVRGVTSSRRPLGWKPVILDVDHLGSQAPADQPTAEELAALSRYLQAQKQQRTAEAAAKQVAARSAVRPHQKETA